MQTIAAAIAQREDLEDILAANAKRERNRARLALLNEVRSVGPVGRDVANYIGRFKFGYDSSHDLTALLSVREWTTLHPQDIALVQQQRRVANILGVRSAWEAALADLRFQDSER